MKTSTLKSTTPFGMGKVRHHHQKDQILADVKHRLTDHIAKTRPRIEIRRAGHIDRS